MMQCKDIPTKPILDFIAKVEQGFSLGANWAKLDADDPKWPYIHRSVRNAMPVDLPDKLILAKMKQLIANDLVAGCACGCRGDFTLTDRGRLAAAQ